MMFYELLGSTMPQLMQVQITCINYENATNTLRTTAHNNVNPLQRLSAQNLPTIQNQK